MKRYSFEIDEYGLFFGRDDMRGFSASFKLTHPVKRGSLCFKLDVDYGARIYEFEFSFFFFKLMAVYDGL